MWLERRPARIGGDLRGGLWLPCGGIASGVARRRFFLLHIFRILFLGVWVVLKCTGGRSLLAPDQHRTVSEWRDLVPRLKPCMSTEMKGSRGGRDSAGEK